MIDDSRFASQIPVEFDATIAAVQAVKALAPELARASKMIGDALLAGRKLLCCGNGGSAADASHLATEIVVRLADDRPAYPAISLCDSGSTLTAASNDYGFDHVFERQIQALGQAGDVLVAFSTSGNSKSVVLALREARSRGLATIAFLGKTGGACKGLADVELIVPSDATARIQECHQVMYHCLCKLIDPALKMTR